MITRRHLLTGGLAVAASALTGKRFVSATHQPNLPRQWQRDHVQYAQAHRWNDNAEPDFATYTLQAMVEPRHLKELRWVFSPIVISAPFLTGGDNTGVGELSEPRRSRFNLSGYRGRYGAHGVYIPIRNRKHANHILIRVWIVDHLPDGSTRTYRTRGRPGRWLWAK